MDKNAQNLTSAKPKRVKTKRISSIKKERSFSFNMSKSSFATAQTKDFLLSRFQKTSITTHSSNLPPPSLRLRHQKKTTTFEAIQKLQSLMDFIFVLYLASVIHKKSISFGSESRFTSIKKTCLSMWLTTFYQKSMEYQRLRMKKYGLLIFTVEIHSFWNRCLLNAVKWNNKSTFSCLRKITPGKAKESVFPENFHSTYQILY